MAERKDIKTPDEIREDIERTRSEMNETIGLISDKFSADSLKGRFLNEVRGFGKAGSKAKELNASLIDTVRRNPIPAAMAGIGLYLLFTKRTSGGRVTVALKGEEGFGAKGKAEHAVGEFKGKVSELKAKAREKKEEYSRIAREKAGQAGVTASERTYAAKNRVWDIIHDNPLVSVAAAFAIGSAIGLSLPETRKERDVLGEAGETVRETAREAAKSVEEEVSEVKKTGEDIDRAA